MIRRLLAVILVGIVPVAHAFDAVLLDIETVATQGWSLQGAAIALTELAKNQQQLALTVKTVVLPKPLNDLSLVNLRCTSFTWTAKQMACKQGRATLRSTYWQSPSTNFSFQIDQKRSTFKLTELSLAGTKLAVEGMVDGDRWQLQIKTKQVDVAVLNRLFPQQFFALTAGKIDLNLNVSGIREILEKFTMTAQLDGLSGQTVDGKIATEGLMLKASLDAGYKNGFWQVQSKTTINGGAIYLEPLYLDAKGQTIQLDAQANWDIANQQLDIKTARYQHANVASLSGNAALQFKDGINIQRADLDLHSESLTSVSSIYLTPFLAQTAWEGITLSGKARANIAINDQSLKALTAVFDDVSVNDSAERLHIDSGSGTLNWASDTLFNKPSALAWQQLQIYALPMGQANLAFLTQASNFSLLNKPRIPFLGGTIAIDEFSWQAEPQQEPKVIFKGGMTQVSLEQLSKALNWTPLSGSISGEIPQVNYSNKTLSLDGELLIHVFDGVVKISNLATSGLLTALPKFHADLEIDNLDMEQLTGKFEFGGITGKLSGYVRQLYLENWQPISFYAWLGTPDDDNSKHRISQKAVKNIANIGGGAAADALSRSFLSFFETFGYDKLGLGCYLHEGVCQLMGVEATPSGYAIITGGGLPRIDVIGYNPRVDWAVLMERLKRITTSDEVIIK
ncbi:MAG: C4-dicarboxylate ABC transporter [Methylococcaceae bacterium]|nr:C4-dicarboxylate ABC transporter [Methylococcaceae bacterium]MDZ4157755.1 C4-dicarboxylate ABC transporter [Methylococcales bacterium]MDP2392098.1 C4-dicarboxylate ABC transporter [Methylococcaceae bacterium]MDP3020850.1 C4-dicarboxylate ABC transporter [Methylococcaceae bacterium]MDP3391668.1 C4-dicarboxylate ABC transporter [Methylococcaceae bacterium]